jgi:hypothetical protein
MNMQQRVDEREADKENCGVAPPRTFKKQPQRAPLRDITNEKVRPLPPRRAFCNANTARHSSFSEGARLVFLKRFSRALENWRARSTTTAAHVLGHAIAPLLFESFSRFSKAGRARCV